MADVEMIVRRVVFLIAAQPGSSTAAAAIAAAAAAAGSAGAAAQDVVTTGLDRIATGGDRVQTGLDRVATGQDRTATAADRVQTGLDRVATGQDRTATGTAAGATAADRVQTGLDAAAGSASAAAGLVSQQAAASSAAAAAASVPATADRTVGRRLNDTDIWAMSRSTKTWGFGVTGSLEETPVDTLRWEFNPATLAPLGPQFAGLRVNTIRNPLLEGAVPGSPGTNPTNMSLALGATSGVNVSIAGVGTLANGMKYVDVAMAGLATATVTLLMTLEQGGLIAAALGEVWSMAASVALTAGNPANVSVQPTFRSNVGGTGLVGGAYTLTATLARFPFTGTLAQAGTTSIIPVLRVTYASGVTAAETLRIALPDLEKAPFSSAPKPAQTGVPAATTRAQGTVDIAVAQLGTRWNRRQGIIIVDWASQPGPFTSAVDADWFGLCSWGDKTANERLGLLINPAHTSVEARITAGGVVQAAASRALTAPAASVITRAAVAWDLDAGKLQVAARGAAGAQVALTALPVPGWIMPGRFGTSHPLFGTISGVEIRPAALFDAALAALT
ncbi:MAG: 49, APCd hypothetical protein [Rubritepida sp.]|nr:49, APCd hypothetical protein [Rubritepida sp.]